MLVSLLAISFAAGISSAGKPVYLPIVIASAACIAGVSWIDDLKSLRRSVRFTMHLVAASAVIWALGPIREITLPPIGTLALGPTAIPITLVWIVGLTNAFNFMDGIDGIAGLQAIIAGVGWTALGASDAISVSMIVGVSLSSASLGFLIYNWPPAKIFMGDVGSAYLGFMFAVTPLLCTRDRSQASIAAILFVWPFVFDATFTFVRRLLRREKVFEAHRSHLYQRLVIAGWPHSRVTTLYGCLAVCGLLSAVSDCRPIIPILLALLLGSLLWVLVITVESRDAQPGKNDRSL